MKGLKPSFESNLRHFSLIHSYGKWVECCAMKFVNHLTTVFFFFFLCLSQSLELRNFIYMYSNFYLIKYFIYIYFFFWICSRLIFNLCIKLVENLSIFSKWYLILWEKVWFTLWKSKFLNGFIIPMLRYCLLWCKNRKETK